MKRNNNKKTNIRSRLMNIAKWFFIAATTFTTLIVSVGTIYDRYYRWVTLTCNSTKFISYNNVLYIADIVNESPTHADDIAFSGEFKNGIIKSFEVTPNFDIRDRKDIKYGNPEDYGFFTMKRLSRKGGSCYIEINVTAKSTVEENMHISGKNVNHTAIIAKLAVEESKQQFKNNARNRWLERNYKGINK